MESNVSESGHLPFLAWSSSSEEPAFAKATFGMGCFWGPEALFGSLPGVMHTRVGYAGGSTPTPTYKDLGDHTETVQIWFDEAIISYETILQTFWEKHNPININGYKGRQYQSILHYHDAGQLDVIEAELERREQAGLSRPDTEVAAYAELYLAEERHQKYYVKRFPGAVAALESLYPGKPGEQPAWSDSTIAARLNGMAKGYLNLEQLRSEIGEWRLSEDKRHKLLRTIMAIRW